MPLSRGMTDALCDLVAALVDECRERVLLAKVEGRMRDKPRAVVVAERLPDGRVEIFARNPHNGRNAKVGLKVSADRAEAEIQRHKGLLEQAGNHVEVIERGF